MAGCALPSETGRQRAIVSPGELESLLAWSCLTWMTRQKGSE